jgi:hypothetical protein
VAAHRSVVLLVALAVMSGLAACTQSNVSGTVRGTAPPATGPQPTGADGVPRPDHVVVVVMENKDAVQALDARAAPYIDELSSRGASFTDAHALMHPSQPNYLALFSGSTQGVTNDDCPQQFDGPNLGRALLDSGAGFAGYAEGLPTTGYSGCDKGGYARKHAPWTDFTNLPGSVNKPLSEFGPDYSTLPAVSFVIPNLCHDMHDCTRAEGDSWLHTNLDGYVQWAREHRSLLVLTFDEADHDRTNRIATTFVGPMVKAGTYDEFIDHYRVLRTIEDMYSLPHAGRSADAKPITDVWNTG